MSIYMFSSVSEPGPPSYPWTFIWSSPRSSGDAAIALCFLFPVCTAFSHPSRSRAALAPVPTYLIHLPRPITHTPGSRTRSFMMQSTGYSWAVSNDSAPIYTSKSRAPTGSMILYQMNMQQFIFTCRSIASTESSPLCLPKTPYALYIDRPGRRHTLNTADPVFDSSLGDDPPLAPAHRIAWRNHSILFPFTLSSDILGCKD